MRDMLEMLQTISEEQQEYKPGLYGPVARGDNGTLSQEAVVFENSTDIHGILREAHSIRQEISVLHLEVERLGGHNERFGTSVRRLTLLKKDSETIARGIRQRGEAVHTRLRALGAESSRVQEEEGPNSAVSRIACVQYNALIHAFHAAMSGYHRAEEMQRRMCRGRIQRQASIMGAEITDEQLDALADRGGEGWDQLCRSLQTQGARSSRWALGEIRGRHKELLELESRLREAHDLFLQMAMLVEEQGSMLNNIEANVRSTEDYVENINVHIKKALQYRRKNPFRQCCPCLPCWKYNQTF